MTLRCYTISSAQYFNWEQDIVIVAFRGQETKFMIADIEEDHARASQINTTFSNIKDKFARCEVQREADGHIFCSQTHLGHILKHGDTVLGYDIGSINCTEDLNLLKHQKGLPDVILIRKHYDRKRGKKIWKLKRMDVDDGDMLPNKRTEKRREMDLEEFEDEIEQNKGMRKNFNLYKVSLSFINKKLEY